MSEAQDTSHRAQQIPGYQIMNKLGAGAMATVYKARQMSLDRLVAIKVLPKKFEADEDFIRRFYEEGKAAAKLNHPNIVGAYDVGYSGEYHYFVMEFVDGWMAHDDIVKDGKYNEERALEIAIDIAEALRHAHKRGFIHRDVKPKNIMITRDGTAKLADMGLARAVSDRDAAEAEKGKAFGTPYYIAPEQVRGETTIDHRADIYSLGATLFHMLTGRVPFEGPNPSAVMYRHLRDELTPPDQVNKNLSSGISEVIEVCMAKEPAKRYGDCADLLIDLKCVQRGEKPQIATRQFSIADLSALEEVDAKAEQPKLQRAVASRPNMTALPIFWLAIAGWGCAALFFLLFVMALTGVLGGS